MSNKFSYSIRIKIMPSTGTKSNYEIKCVPYEEMDVDGSWGESSDSEYEDDFG